MPGMGLAAVISEVRFFERMEPEDRDSLFGFALREFYRALAVVLGLVDSSDRNGFYKEDGHRSNRAWIQAAGNTSGQDASWLVGLMRTLATMPYAAEDFADGALGLSQLGELVKLHRTPAVRARLGEGDEMLLGFARSMPFDDFRDAARHFREVVDPDGTDRRHRAADEGRNATTGVVGEEFFLNAHCGTAQGAEIAEILDRFTQAEFLADMDELRERCGENAPTIMLRRTHAQRRADALSKIFTTAATASGLVKPGEAIVNYVIDDQTFEETLAKMTGTWAGPQDLFGDDLAKRVKDYRSETTTGIPIDPYVIVAAALNGRLRRIVVDSRGVPVNIGRVQRFFTGPLREVLQMLWKRCFQPGCDVPAGRCEIDHVIGFTLDGGETSACNGVPGCGCHNRWKHDHGYRVWLDPNGQWHTYRPNGTEIAPRYDPTRPDHPNGREPFRP